MMTKEAQKKFKKLLQQSDSFADLMSEYEDCGFCFNCGAIRYGDTEPDAQEYPCDECGEHKVYGIEETMFYYRSLFN